jgi:peptide/nickel transport system substrate-binding protein
VSDYWQKRLREYRATRRGVLAVAGSASAAAILAACGSGGSSSSSSGGGGQGASSASSSAASQPKAPGGSFSPGDGTAQPGGRYVFTATTVANFNPVAEWADGTNLGGAQVYDRPVTSREDSRHYVLEALASAETPDPLTLVMKLKPATYHNLPPVNGRAVKASDIVATQQYISTETRAFDRTFQRDFLDKAEAPDDLTVIYHMKKPNGYLFSQSMLGSGTSQPIVPQETIEGLYTNKQIGSGPYYVDSAQLGVDYVYKKFDKYHEASKGLPYIAEREVKFMTDNAALEAAFRANQIDRLLAPSATQMDSLPKDMGDKIRAFQVPGFATFDWMLNMSKPLPWQKDVRVREAFWRLTNRQQILDLALGGKAALSVGLMPPGLKLYQLDPKDVDSYYTEDVAKAKQLLAAANFDLNKEWELFTQFPGSYQEQSALVWQQQVQRAGIKTRIATVAGSAQLFQRWTDNDWELQVQSGPGSDSPGQALRLQHSKSWSDTFKNFALFDPAIDAQIEKAEQLTNIDENIKLVKQIQMDCIKQFTSCYQLATINQFFMIRGRVQNFDLTVVNPVYRNEMWLKQT